MVTITDSASDSPQTAALAGTGQDFSLAPPGSQSTATVSAGQPANYTVTITPGGGFNQTVMLVCSGAPAQSTCSVSPPVQLSLAISAATATVTVTAGSTASLAHPAGFPPASGTLAVWLAFCGLSGLALLGSDGRSRKRHGRLLYGLAFLCLISLGIALSSCGGGSTSREQQHRK